MSADTIATCPKCKQRRCREWIDIGFLEDEDFAFFVEFEAKCPECDFTWSFHKKMPVKIEAE